MKLGKYFISIFCPSLALRRKARPGFYASAENDKYYLYVEINGYLASLGMTELFLASRCSSEAIDERCGGGEARQSYLDELRRTKGMEAFVAVLDEERKEAEQLGNDPARQAAYIRKELDAHVRAYLEAKENGGKTFPDFIGALVMDDLARCAELSAIYRAMRQEEDQARAAREAEEEKAFCEEKNKAAEQAVAEAVRIIREGGELKNGRVNLAEAFAFHYDEGAQHCFLWKTFSPCVCVRKLKFQNTEQLVILFDNAD